MNIRTFSVNDLEAVLALWQLTFPEENDGEQVIKTKLNHQAELFFVFEIDNHIVGTVIAGFDGVRGWLHKVATHPDHRGKRIARQLIDHALQALAEIGCAKVNLQVRSGNEAAVSLYEALGFKQEDRISLGKRLD